jgi:hydroxyacylglutathione hydrolase
VGPLEENTYIVRSSPDSRCAVMIDPGEDAERLLSAVHELDVEIEAILITHCHFDHVGAVAAVAGETGSTVYCPELEREILAAIMDWVPPGFGPFDSYEPEHTVAGGERLMVAGLDIDVIFTPGHSPGHVTYAMAVPKADADCVSLFSGDVLFKGMVGRADLPGGSWRVLKQSIGTLLGSFAQSTAVYPGHGCPTSLGEECSTSSLVEGLRPPN